MPCIKELKMMMMMMMIIIIIIIIIIGASSIFIRTSDICFGFLHKPSPVCREI
jgi:hypothetical protein